MVSKYILATQMTAPSSQDIFRPFYEITVPERGDSTNPSDFSILVLNYQYTNSDAARNVVKREIRETKIPGIPEYHGWKRSHVTTIHNALTDAQYEIGSGRLKREFTVYRNSLPRAFAGIAGAGLVTSGFFNPKSAAPVLIGAALMVLSGIGLSTKQYERSLEEYIDAVKDNPDYLFYSALLERDLKTEARVVPAARKYVEARKNDIETGLDEYDPKKLNAELRRIYNRYMEMALDISLAA